MSHPDIITTSIWDEPGTVDTLRTMWTDGASASEIARAIGQGVSRSSVLGKAHRLKLQQRQPRQRVDRVTSNTVPLITGKKGRSGNPGVPSVLSIKHRAEGRLKAERARQEGRLSHRGQQPFRAPGRTDVDDDGVDATHLIAFADRRIGKDCSWIPGDALDGAMCCGKPVVESTQWCAEHLARVYSNKGALV